MLDNIHVEWETKLSIIALRGFHTPSLNFIKLIAKVSSVISWEKNNKNFLLHLLKYCERVELIKICLKLTIKVVNIIENIEDWAISIDDVINCPLPANTHKERSPISIWDKIPDAIPRGMYPIHIGIAIFTPYITSSLDSLFSSFSVCIVSII